MSRWGKWCSLVAAAGVPVAVAAMVVGQLGGAPRLDPLDLTIGEYVALDGGGVTAVAMAVLGVASLAVVGGLRAVRAPAGRTAERLMLVWSAALIVIAVAPTAAPVHLSTVAFGALTAAAALLVPRLGADERWRVAARPVEWLALAGGFGLLAITYLALPGNGLLIGLVERVSLAVAAVLLGVLAVRLVQLTWAPVLVEEDPRRGRTSVEMPALFVKDVEISEAGVLLRTEAAA